MSETVLVTARTRRVLRAVAVLAALTSGVDGMSRTEQVPGPVFAEFGVSVATSPDTLFVAACPVKDGRCGQGEVNVFERRLSGWVKTDVLPVPEARAQDSFGVSMATDGATLVVGAQFADARGDDTGLAYVFEARDGRWQRTAVLFAGDGAAGDEFGLTVSVSGETIAVGARLFDGQAVNTGAAYIFARDDGNWRQVRKLTASDAKAGDIFGRVSIDKDLLLVSADLNDDRGSNAGKAYAFQNRGGEWVEEARITASDGAAVDEFGVSLALKGGVAVFGAVGSDARSEDSGAAYVFERREGRWVEAARLTASNVAARQAFGYSVATSDDTIVVGAPNHGGAGLRAGAAYVFERRGGIWTEAARLTASDVAPGMWFGNSVAIDRDRIVVGMLFSGEGNRSGSAYVFERGAAGWSEVARLHQ